MGTSEESTQLEDEMHSVNNPSSFFVNLKFDCSRLSDGIVHRENLLVDLRDVDFSLNSLHHLIESKLNIPRICQLEIFLEEILMNASSTDLIANLLKRIRSKLEPTSICLRYFSACTQFNSIRTLVERFESGLQHLNYRDLIRTIELIDMDHIYGAGEGWGSIEATAVRLYLVDVGFLDKVYSFIQHMNDFLMNALKHKIQTTLGRFLSRARRKHPTPELDLVVQTLSAALGMLWNFGANVEDRQYLFERGFYRLFRSTLEITMTLRESKKRSWSNLGDTLFRRSFGVFGAFAETRQAAIHLGTDDFFLLILRNVLLNPNLYSSYDLAMASLIMFFLTSHSSISLNLIISDSYSTLARRFAMDELTLPPIVRLTDVLYNIRYFVCLILINMVKTPNTENLPSSVAQDIQQVWTHFLDRVGNTNIIARFEKDHKVIWGTLEPFISLFFIPKHSFIGLLMQTDYDNVMVQAYLKIVRFSLEVVLRLDKNIEQIFEENLFTQLIFADWRLGEISTKLRKYFPNLIYFPVPSLYDISALTCICEGLGNYSTFYHS